MDYLTFFYLLSPRNPFPVRRRNDTSFSTATQSGIIEFCCNYNESKKIYPHLFRGNKFNLNSAVVGGLVGGLLGAGQ